MCSDIHNNYSNVIIGEYEYSIEIKSVKPEEYFKLFGRNSAKSEFNSMLMAKKRRKVMADSRKDSDNCFREFDDVSPKRKEPSIQVLYDYEKHYMELVKKYASEIKMIADMLCGFRKEQEIFYKETLPRIIEQLNQDAGIDEEMKNMWLTRLTTNIDRSFGLSETLINDYVTKNIDEFKVAVNEAMKKLS